ncbi:MAG: hypothetical protein IH586_07165 [Anaerolineaceae bacterium]|nr:hypothetical protein [Anaerolineaceae bacterium]
MWVIFENFLLNLVELFEVKQGLFVITGLLKIFYQIWMALEKFVPGLVTFGDGNSLLEVVAGMIKQAFAQLDT